MDFAVDTDIDLRGGRALIKSNVRLQFLRTQIITLLFTCSMISDEYSQHVGLSHTTFHPIYMLNI